MSLAFDAKRGLIVVPARLWGPARSTIVRLALDTGATASTLNWDLAAFLGYDPIAVTERMQMTTGSGVEFVPKVLIAKIRALDLEREPFPVLCHTLPPSAIVDGVLGLDFLRGRRLVLDFRIGLAILD